MIRILFIPLLDTKIAYHQGEMYFPFLVCTYSLGGSFWCIAVGFEVFLERFVFYDTLLHQLTHYSFVSDVYVYIVLIVVQVLLVCYLLGNEFDCYSVIFALISWIVRVEVLDIYYKIFAIWGREYAVTMDFGRVLI